VTGRHARSRGRHASQRPKRVNRERLSARDADTMEFFAGINGEARAQARRFVRALVLPVIASAAVDERRQHVGRWSLNAGIQITKFLTAYAPAGMADARMPRSYR